MNGDCRGVAEPLSRVLQLFGGQFDVLLGRATIPDATSPMPADGCFLVERLRMPESMPCVRTFREIRRDWSGQPAWLGFMSEESASANRGRQGAMSCTSEGTSAFAQDQAADAKEAMTRSPFPQRGGEFGKSWGRASS